ncbi:hypothetical protein GCM10022245_38530 [Streptomyces mayteni]
MLGMSDMSDPDRESGDEGPSAGPRTDEWKSWAWKRGRDWMYVPSSTKVGPDPVAVNPGPLQ